MKVWVTKYWNTKGIYQVNTDGKERSSKDYVYTEKGDGFVHMQLKLGRDAFLMKNDAVVWCNIQVEKQKRSLQAKLQRLERMVFKHDQLKGFPPRKGTYG